MSKSEYYIEFYPLGNSVKVSAVDPVTLKEAVIIGPANASKTDLQNLAIKKLNYLLMKDQKQ